MVLGHPQNPEYQTFQVGGRARGEPVIIAYGSSPHVGVWRTRFLVAKKLSCIQWAGRVFFVVKVRSYLSASPFSCFTSDCSYSMTSEK